MVTHESCTDCWSVLSVVVSPVMVRLLPPSPGEETAMLGAVVPHLPQSLQLNTA